MGRAVHRTMEFIMANKSLSSKFDTDNKMKRLRKTLKDFVYTDDVKAEILKQIKLKESSDVTKSKNKLIESTEEVDGGGKDESITKLNNKLDKIIKETEKDDEEIEVVDGASNPMLAAIDNALKEIEDDEEEEEDVQPITKDASKVHLITTNETVDLGLGEAEQLIDLVVDGVVNSLGVETVDTKEVRTIIKTYIKPEELIGKTEVELEEYMGKAMTALQEDDEKLINNVALFADKTRKPMFDWAKEGRINRIKIKDTIQSLTSDEEIKSPATITANRNAGLLASLSIF